MNVNGVSCINVDNTEDSFIQNTFFDNIDFQTVIDLGHGSQFFIDGITFQNSDFKKYGFNYE